jgi:hypothetical protein
MKPTKMFICIYFVFFFGCNAEDGFLARKKNTMKSLEWSSSDPNEISLRDNLKKVIFDSDEKELSIPNIYYSSAYVKNDVVFLTVQWVSIKPYATHVKIQQGGNSMTIPISKEAAEHNDAIYREEKIMLFDAPVVINPDDLKKYGIDFLSPFEVSILSNFGSDELIQSNRKRIITVQDVGSE